MRTPPSIPMPVIAEALQAAHDIETPTFTFVRGSDDGWNFNIASPSGAYRLKVYDKVSDIGQRLAAAYALRHDAHIANIVAPLMGSTGLTFAVDQWRAALFPYIFATNVSGVNRLNAAQAGQLGGTLAAIHAAGLDEVPLPDENFSAEAADALDSMLTALPQAGAGAHRSRQALALLLSPVADRLRAEADALREAALDARRGDFPLVVCHGNPTGDNILVGDGIYLVDWDDARRGAKEMDLMHFADYDPIWRGYAEAGGETLLDPHSLRYYRALWNNQIVAGYVGRVLYEDASPAHHDHDIAQLRNFLRDSGLGGDRI